MTGTDLKPLLMDPTVEPWERQPAETVMRYHQFCAYRDLGRARTLRKVSEALHRNDRYLRSVSAAYRWVERCEAFDRHRDQLNQAAWLEQSRKARADDAVLLDAVVGKVAQRLRTLQPEELEPGDVARFLDVVMKHRRALFGDPSVTVAVTGPGGDPLTVQLAEFSAMPTDQRREAITNLVAAVARKSEAAAGVDDDDD